MHKLFNCVHKSNTILVCINLQFIFGFIFYFWFNILNFLCNIRSSILISISYLIFGLDFHCSRDTNIFRSTKVGFNINSLDIFIYTNSSYSLHHVWIYFCHRNDRKKLDLDSIYCRLSSHGYMLFWHNRFFVLDEKRALKN